MTVKSCEQSFSFRFTEGMNQTHGLCEFLNRVDVLCSCSEHKVLLADDSE